MSTAAYQAQEQGYLAELGQMTSALQSPHFLVVSLWANDWTAAQGAGQFEIEFRASPWSTATSTALEAPAQPAAALDVDVAGAIYL